MQQGAQPKQAPTCWSQSPRSWRARCGPAARSGAVGVGVWWAGRRRVAL